MKDPFWHPPRPFVGPIEPLTEATIERMLTQLAESPLDPIHLPVRAKVEWKEVYYGSAEPSAGDNND